MPKVKVRLRPTLAVDGALTIEEWHGKHDRLRAIEGPVEVPKAPISTGGEPGTMGGDGLTGPGRERGTHDNAGSQDQVRREQGRTDSAQRAEKKVPERLRRLKDLDRIED